MAPHSNPSGKKRLRTEQKNKMLVILVLLNGSYVYVDNRGQLKGVCERLGPIIPTHSEVRNGYSLE
jgi:hypothetical protein